jgi:hypothetical protein
MAHTGPVDLDQARRQAIVFSRPEGTRDVGVADHQGDLQSIDGD